MDEKCAKVVWYLSLILAEPSTWRGLAFITGLISGHEATGDWGQAAAIGGTVSAMFKIFLPDSVTKLKLPTKEDNPNG